VNQPINPATHGESGQVAKCFANKK